MRAMAWPSSSKELINISNMLGAVIASRLNKAEYYFFYVFLVINLLPILVFKFFPTVDGPAHLYNSRLIIELLGQNSLLDNYFIFNEIAPNWLGHILLSFFQLLFPAYIAEKCLLLIYFIGFPVSFRAFIKIQPDHNNTLIYLVFPFLIAWLSTNEISKASLKIEPFKTVLPVKNSDNWLHGHASNYLGIDKPMVILENYEASLDYFPIRWNRNNIPNLYFGEMSSANDCLSWESNSNNDIAVIDYIFLLNDEQESISNECINQISDQLKNDYLEVYKS